MVANSKNKMGNRSGLAVGEVLRAEIYFSFLLNAYVIRNVFPWRAGDSPPFGGGPARI